MDTNFTTLIIVTLLILIAKTSSANSANDKSYVKKACDKTKYSAQCFKSLSPFSATIKSNPNLLCKFAAKTALSYAIAAKSGAAEIAKSKGLTKAERAVARDCFETIDDAADELRRCHSAFDGAEGLTAKKRKVRMSGARTWASAALTDDYTCTDEMGEMRVRLAKMGGFKQLVLNAAKSTTILLAIIKSYCTS